MVLGESVIYTREASLPALRSALLWASCDGTGQGGARTAERRTYPCFLALLVSLEDMKALRALVIVLLQAIHRSLGCSLAGTKGVVIPRSDLGRSELTLRLSCKPPWPARLDSAQVQKCLSRTHLELLSVRLRLGCGGSLGHGGE